LTSCSRNEPSRTEFALGTICTVTLYDQGQARVYNNIFSRLHEIENLMSVNIPSSDISRINAAAGIESVQVHEDTFKVIKRAVYFASLTGGAFDPTVGPLVSLWDIGGINQRIPSQEEIEAVLPLINWQNIELNASTRNVFLTHPGMALDLGGIAKGYAADETLKIISAAGIDRAIINLGGDIITYGERRDRNLWRIGIQHPLEERGTVIGYLQIPAKTVVTSGIYERFFTENEMRYHHIFSPSPGLPGKPGYPAQSGLLSVTLISDTSMDADALSTAIFVLGYERGMALFGHLPGTDAVFIFEDRSIRATPGVNFTLTDSAFRLE
jgi:thiamine biosynthesis lipoprotein